MDEETRKRREATRERKARGQTLGPNGLEVARDNRLDTLRTQRRITQGGANLMRGAGKVQGDKPVLTDAEKKESDASILASMVLTAERSRKAALEIKDFNDAHEWEREELKAYRALIDLVGQDEADRLTSAANTQELADRQAQDAQDAEPDLDYWASYLAGKAVPFNAGTAKKPAWITVNYDDLPPETQEQMRQTAEDINKQTGNADPFDILGKVTAGGVNADWLKTNAERLQRQQEEKRAENEARYARQAERERVQQEFKERQFQANQERQKILDEERRQAAAKSEARADQREQDRQADRAAGQVRQAARDQQSAADRDAADIAKQAAQQNAIQRAIDATNVRRRQLAVSTAQRAVTVAARTQVRLESLPRPGGIGLMLIAIGFILFAIQPVNPNGATRLQLMFYALMPWVDVTLPESRDGTGGGTGIKLPGPGLKPPGIHPKGLPPPYALTDLTGTHGTGTSKLTGVNPSDVFTFSDLPAAVSSAADY